MRAMMHARLLKMNERDFPAKKPETPLEAYYRRINAIRNGDKTIWDEINGLTLHEKAQYLFFKKYGDKPFEQIR